ncbi:MAG: sodium-dependent transporter [Clostridia bacterium]|nr:sodium-dependent transporter [Clostridia bacterium]
MSAQNNDMKREKFSSGIAVFFATLGSAVGLGNIWKFPYLTGQNGGGAFLFVYLLCILLVGIPVMVSEFYIGRKTRKNAVGAFEALKPGTPWKGIGLMGVAAAYLIMFFYSCVAGWVYSYVFKAIKGDFAGITADTAKAQFGSTVVGPLPPLLWQIIVMAVVSLILISGVKKGIERVTKTLMPVLFILVIICGIRAITLPGAFAGLEFLFRVDFAKITPPVILTALGLAFFKLSLGMGTMMTYASYFTDDNHMMATSAKVALSDTAVSILAGIAIFPAVFSFGMEPGAGPGLLFMTIPLVFSKMMFGNILLIAFFVLTSIAATTAMLSLVEVPVAYMTEEKGISRRNSVLINSFIILLFGTLATFSADKSSLLGGIQFWGRGFFDWFDFISSNILLPVGGLLIVLFVGYFIKKEDIFGELSNRGRLNNGWLVQSFLFLVRFISPLLLLLVFLNSLGILKF